MAGGQEVVGQAMRPEAQPTPADEHAASQLRLNLRRELCDMLRANNMHDAPMEKKGGVLAQTGTWAHRLKQLAPAGTRQTIAGAAHLAALMLIPDLRRQRRRCWRRPLAPRAWAARRCQPCSKSARSCPLEGGRRGPAPSSSRVQFSPSAELVGSGYRWGQKKRGRGHFRMMLASSRLELPGIQKKGLEDGPEEKRPGAGESWPTSTRADPCPSRAAARPRPCRH